MNNNILLINPPATADKRRSTFTANFPLGLGYIAAVLERASYQVSVLDAVIEEVDRDLPVPNNNTLINIGMTHDEIRQFISNNRPDVVGISSMFTYQFNNTVMVADVVKSVDPEIVVIVGGAHPTADPKGALEHKSIDFVVVGEGENIIPPLLDALRNGDNPNEIGGIGFRGAEGEIINTPRPPLPDVSSIPWPARHLFPMEKYFSAGQRHGMSGQDNFRSVSILTERGCPFDCNFCSAYQMFGKKLRNRKVDDILSEIDFLVRKYKVNDIFLADDQFLGNRKNTITLLDGLIERNYGISIDAPNGLSPWIFTDEILCKMRKAGFWRLQLAVESGNPWVLKNIIKKPVNLEKLPQLVNVASEFGFKFTAAVVVGNVSETAIETFDQMRDTFNLMRKLKIRRPSVSYLSPHLGSEAYDVVRKRKLVGDTYGDDFYNKPSFSTPLWTARELEHFVVAQRILCAIEGSPLLWPIKAFAGRWNGFLEKERHLILFYLFDATRRTIFFREFLTRWLLSFKQAPKGSLSRSVESGEHTALP